MTTSALALRQSQWNLWSEKRRRDADATRRLMIKQAVAAKELVDTYSCKGCDAMITVKTDTYGPKFEKPFITHELGCTA